MIQWLVDFLSGMIQLLIWVTIGIGCLVAMEAMPDAWLLEFGLTPTKGKKFVVGGVATFLTLVLVLGPHLILLDMRNAVRAIERRQR